MRTSLARGIDLDRRRVVTWTALGAALAAGFPARVLAQSPNAAVDCLTVLYPAGDGLHMDVDYDRDHHIPLLRERFGAVVERIELRSIAPSPGPAPAPFLAAANIWISDLATFSARVAEFGDEFRASMAQYTNSAPVTQLEQVLGAAGAGRDAIQVGDGCLTILYPRDEGGSFDADYYRDQHMPLIMDLYGAAAIKRMELRQPADGAGAPPSYAATVNIYVNDAEAFAAAGAAHGQTLRDDVANFSSVMPLAVQTQVHGIV